MRSLEGDTLLAAGRLEEAEVAYRSFLSKHESSPLEPRALYRLGLIYSLPDSPLHDPDRARDVLQQLAEHSRGGLYSRQATLVLTLQAEISRLGRTAETHASLAARLENELGRLEEEAAQATTEAGQHETRARRLTSEISILRTEIARLTESLEQREEELERIKEIDLGRTP
jgi:TolA-binding protein